MADIQDYFEFIITKHEFFTEIHQFKFIQIILKIELFSK